MKKEALSDQKITKESHVFSNQETGTALIQLTSDTFPIAQVQLPPLAMHTFPTGSALAADSNTKYAALPRLC